MAIVNIGNVEVVVRTRDEHCPPHVHADCSPEGWSARFKFGFLSDDVEFWDFHQPDNPKRPPSQSRLNTVGQAVFENLVTIRKRWWEVMGTVCLDNRYIRVARQGVFLAEGYRIMKGLPQVRKAEYDPANQTLTVILSDGTAHEQNLEGR